MRSEGTVDLNIELHRGSGQSFPGVTIARSSYGAGTATIETIGEGFGMCGSHSIDAALGDPAQREARVLQTGATWVTQMVSTQLGGGLSFGTENGVQASVGWNAGGDLATQNITERMTCIGWDCVGGDQPWNKLFAQEGSVLAKAGLNRGLFARVHAKTTFRDFRLRALVGEDGACVPCATEPGYHDPVVNPPL